MIPITSFLLSFFTNNERFGHDVNSLHRRYQTLSLIYVNLGGTLLVVTYSFVTWFFFDVPNQQFMGLVCVPLSLLGLYFVRAKNLLISQALVMIEMHCSNLLVSYTTNCPLVALYGIMIYPFFAFSLTSSLKLHLFNALMCVYEYHYNMSKALKIFEVTLTEDQYNQVIILIAGGFLCVVTAVGISILQKSVESNIWRIAQENYLKSENLTKEVVQAMEAKDAFVSMLSHEIRNPLNLLKGSIDYLLQVIKEQSYIQVLKNAKVSGDILLNLVNNVLDAAKLKSDKMEIVETETSLLDTIKKVFIINSEKFKEKELNVKAFIDDRVPEQIWLDSSRLLQILMNLVSNAVKFIPPRGKITLYASWCHPDQKKEELLFCFPKLGADGVPKGDAQGRRSIGIESLGGDDFSEREHSIMFEEFNTQEEKHSRKQNLLSVQRARRPCSNDLTTISFNCVESHGEGWSIRRTSYLSQEENDDGSVDSLNHSPLGRTSRGFLKIQITDSGCGIEADYMPKMFGMFEQASQGARSVYGGTGLGLWICKQICNKMKGDISVKSKPGEGTSFVLYIPVDNNKIRRANNNNISQGSFGRNNRIRVLVVDDYSMNRYLHKLLLEQEGVDVSVASNGREAVEKYKTQGQEGYDFIMMDVQMPEMDGFTAVKLIRNWEEENRKRKVRIIFVSGEYFNEEDILASFKLNGGVTEGVSCLRKPLDGGILKRVIGDCKQKRR